MAARKIKDEWGSKTQFIQAADPKKSAAQISAEAAKVGLTISKQMVSAIRRRRMSRQIQFVRHIRALGPVKARALFDQCELQVLKEIRLAKERGISMKTLVHLNYRGGR